MTFPAYDMYLGDKDNPQGFRVRSFVRDTAQEFAPRFATGSDSQSDLDLLKSSSVENFSGGMFQRDWDDNTKVARLVGVYNPYTHFLQPAPQSIYFGESSLDFVETGRILCKAENSLYSFVVFGEYSAVDGFVSKLYRVKFYGSFELIEITLPYAFTSSSLTYIANIAFHGEYLYISSQSAVGVRNNYRMKLSNNTFQDIGSSGVLMAELRGVLYNIRLNSTIYTVTNEFAAGSATYTKVDTIGFSDSASSSPLDAIEFNGALWIAKPDGIFRFDGLKAVKVINLSTSKFIEFNGSLYFLSGQWLYRFDGGNVTKLNFFGNGESFSFNSFTSTPDYLFFSTFISEGSYQAVVDKIPTAGATRRVYCFDGTSFSIIYEEVIPGLFKDQTFGLLSLAQYVFDLSSTAQSASDTALEDIYYSAIDMSQLSEGRSPVTWGIEGSRLEVVTSEFDGGFPNVFKSLSAIELSVDSMVDGDIFDVSYQLYTDDGWSDWIEAGSVTFSSSNKIEITDDTSMLFKRLKVSVVMADCADYSAVSVRGISFRYTLQPRMRWHWQVELMAEGNSTIYDRNGLPITSPANELSAYVNRILQQKTPTYLLAPDYAQVDASVDDATTTFVISGSLPIYSDPYNDHPLIAVKNDSGVWEILKYLPTSSYDSGTDKTTFNIIERGHLDIVPDSISAGAEVRLCYRVYATRLLRDAPILDEQNYAQEDGGNSQLQRELMIEIVEV